ncbi:hypothetical protein GCM10008018_16340 [Paenibacillus marchantiophytorum]|uniref:Uncharacterized protein n=1 Tax=Paenibacillus marchantiophytorum TaxID=1619310 RepID=A0ABQ2BU06_9BACL|nr:hypothetical protein [Paenibacillus marchantiophytorum]GGI46282.1 hypothetical protein GCM10008018_16340 [Paenibacillus marchantiophytorum]
MDFIRKVTNSDALKHIVDLPESLRNQDVELIILPLGDYSHTKQPFSTSPTARGALKQYANLDLIQYEQDAWEKGVQEKHEHR